MANTDKRDAVDGDGKLRKAVDTVQHGYDDRWPARGETQFRTRDYQPLDAVSREARTVEYRGRPHGK